MSLEYRSIITRLGEYLNDILLYIYQFAARSFCMCNFPFKEKKEALGRKNSRYFRRLSFVY